MGRPLKKSFFGNPAAPGAQIFLSSARIAGQSAAAGYYIVRQVGTGRYQVTNGTHTGVVRLVAAGTLQEGEAHLIVKPFGGADEYARVIHNRSVKTWAGKSYAWMPNVAATATGQADLAGTVDTAAVFSVAAAISGTAQVGQTLTASATATDADGAVTYEYRWLSAATETGTYAAISGATASTYVVDVEVGDFIKVEVTAVDAQGGRTTSLSAATAAVIAA